MFALLTHFLKALSNLPTLLRFINLPSIVSGKALSVDTANGDKPIVLGKLFLVTLIRAVLLE